MKNRLDIRLTVLRGKLSVWLNRLRILLISLSLSARLARLRIILIKLRISLSILLNSWILLSCSCSTDYTLPIIGKNISIKARFAEIKDQHFSAKRICRLTFPCCIIIVEGRITFLAKSNVFERLFAVWIFFCLRRTYQKTYSSSRIYGTFNLGVGFRWLRASWGRWNQIRLRFGAVGCFWRIILSQCAIWSRSD